MKKVNWPSLWAQVKPYLLNKYILTVLVFAVVIGFVGEQSLRVQWRKAKEIRALEKKRDAYAVAVDEAKRTIDNLQSTDSLERYAREKYLMHADNEDVYLVDEHD